MRKLLIILLLIFTNISLLQARNVLEPIRYINSCELDFDNNKELDLAFYVETTKGHELIVLLRHKSTFKGYQLYKIPRNDKTFMVMECGIATSVRGISGDASDNKRRNYKTSGTYIALGQPEGAGMAFYFSNGKFHSVWTSD